MFGLSTLILKARDFTTKESFHDIRTHFKPTETFHYTHFSSCNPHGVRKGLIKGEALRLLRTNSSAKSFYENIYNFKKRLRARGYPHNLIEKITSEVKFTERKSALQKNNEVRKKILPFVTTYHPALPNLTNILMSKWHLIQDQPLLREIYTEPPIISYKRAKSLGDILAEQNYKVTYHMHLNVLRITSDLAHIYFTLLYFTRSFPSPSVALHSKRKRYLEAVNLASPADILSGSSRNHSSPHERLLQPVATSVQANWPIPGRLPFFVKRDFDLKFISRVHVNTANVASVLDLVFQKFCIRELNALQKEAIIQFVE